MEPWGWGEPGAGSSVMAAREMEPMLAGTGMTMEALPEASVRKVPAGIFLESGVMNQSS